MDNFVVSARKYRPATFHSVIGQEHITSTLRNAITRGQLAHAYLFCGPRGVGKTTCARIFAKAINCLDPKDGEACNQCESCMSFNEGRSFNIHELDAASNNSVEDIRNLTDQVRIPPQIGRYSVYIIDEVHMLSSAAFNAFLKTLEEPPAHAIFILATTEKHKIIPTILSRCQTYDFNRIKADDAVTYLKYIAGEEGVSFDEESLHIIARKADGGMRDALSMYDKVVSFCSGALESKKVAATLNVLDYDTYFTVTEKILAGDYPAVLLAFDEVLRSGFSCQTFVAGMNNHFRDLLMCKDPNTVPLLEVTGAIADRYKQQSQQCSVPFLFGGIDLLTQAEGALRTTASQRLLVELSLMKLCGLGEKKNDGQVAEPSLPPLVKRETQDKVAPAVVAEKAVEQPVPEVKPVPVEPPVAETVEAVPAPEPDVAPDPAEKNEPEIGVALENAETEPIPAPAPQRTDAPEDKSAASPKPARKSRISLSGNSINDILNGSGLNPDAEDDEARAVVEEEIDGDIEEKLLRACAKFSKEMMGMRPRIGVAFENVTVSANTIHFEVVGDTIKEELLRGHSEIVKRLADIEGIRCSVMFDVTVTESAAATRPIKPEDKLKHLSELNPLLSDLRRELDLEIE